MCRHFVRDLWGILSVEEYESAWDRQGAGKRCGVCRCVLSRLISGAGAEHVADNAIGEADSQRIAPLFVREIEGRRVFFWFGGERSAFIGTDADQKKYQVDVSGADITAGSKICKAMTTAAVTMVRAELFKMARSDMLKLVVESKRESVVKAWARERERVLGRNYRNLGEHDQSTIFEISAENIRKVFT